VQIAVKVAQAIYSDDLTQRGMEHQPWHGRQPLTLTAATLYICTFLGSRVMQPGLQRSLDDVSSICKVGKQTIEETYAELYPLLKSIIPPTIKPPMAEEDWGKFPKPDEKALRKRL
jgi:transcription initiation factor TFIIIB Brf1 subunit/transcription initiation factor TFIIB